MKKYKELFYEIVKSKNYIDNSMNLMNSLDSSLAVRQTDEYIKKYLEINADFSVILDKYKDLYEEFIFEFYQKNRTKLSAFRDAYNSYEVNVLNSMLPIYFSKCKGITEQIYINECKCIRKIIKINSKIFVLTQPQCGIYPVFVKEI